MASLPIIAPSGVGEELHVLADKIRVLAAATQTGSKYEVFELTGPEGSGPPPHSHEWDEAYFILDGEVDLRVGSTEIKARYGDFILAPGGSVHTFKIITKIARFLVLTSGSGGGEFFRAMHREIGCLPPSFEEVCRVAIRQGLALAKS